MSRPVLATAECVIFSNGEGDVDRYVTNLGWILRHWQDVDNVKVTRIYKTDGQYVQNFDCAVFFTLSDGRIFATPFASSEILLDWLNRPVFRGRPLNWYGYDGVCGGEKYRG